MNCDELFFISTIKDYLHGNATIADNEVDWENVFNLASNHQLTAIIYDQCKRLIPERQIDKYKMVATQTLFYNVRFRSEIEKVLENLNKEGILHCVVKGFKIADFYPNWQYRTMGDADILVEDRELAETILTDMGFSCIKNEGNERTYLKKDFEIELHNVLEYDCDIVGSDANKLFFNNYQQYIVNNKLDASFHFLYLFLHLRKHLMKYGVGFRQFVDIAVLTQKCEEIKWDWVESSMAKLNMLGFARQVLNLNNSWFGIIPPIDCGEIDGDFYLSATEYILKNGAFGYSNSDNQDQKKIIEINYSKNPTLYMLTNCLNKIFLGYQAMCSFDYCRFLIDRPYLLPIAWLKRIIYVIRNKDLIVVKNQLSKSFVSSAQLNEKALFLKQWNLI